MSCRLTTVLFALLLAFAARPAAAQEGLAGMESGRWRVRVAAPAAGITELIGATLVQVRGDSLVVEIAGIQKTMALADVTRLQRSEGVQSRVMYAAVGALAGGLAGYGAGLARREFSISGEDKRPVFTATGALVGALLGARFLEGRWRHVPGYAAVVPARSGGEALALGVELRF